MLSALDFSIFELCSEGSDLLCRFVNSYDLLTAELNILIFDKELSK